MTRVARLRLSLALGALAMLLPACGIGGLGIADTNWDLGWTVIANGSKPDVPPFQTSGSAFIAVVKTTVKGTLEGTVDWTLATNPVATSWHRGDCSQDPGCEQLSENATALKPKSVQAVNASPGIYSLVVMNLGTANESITYLITLTP